MEQKAGILHNRSGLSIGFESHFSQNVLHMAYNLVLTVSAHELHESSIIKNVCLSNKWLAEKKNSVTKLGSQQEDPWSRSDYTTDDRLTFPIVAAGGKFFFLLLVAS